MPGRGALAFVLPVACATGFTALVFQALWQRLLTLFVGADVHSVALVLGAFMAGLGLGALAGGHWADRLGARGRLRAFAAAQTVVGGFGLLSVWLYYDVLYGRVAGHLLAPATVGTLAAASLVVPTFFMGASLPLLARTVTPSASQAPARVGVLYGLNTLGGAAGALAGVMVLARSFGLRDAIQLAAGLDLACAVAALVAATRARPDQDVPAEPRQAGGAGPALPFAAWVAVYALSGFIALSLEVVWFRVLRVLLRSDAFTFSRLLSVYLLGLGAGSLLGVWWARRARRPAAAFLAAQAAVTAAAGLSVSTIVWLMTWRHAANVPAHTGGAGAGFQTGTGAGGLGALIPFALILPPTLLMGACWPLLQRVVQVDLGHLGRRVGWLQAANIFGATAGAVLSGLVLLDWIGSSGTLRLMAGLGGVFLLLGAWRCSAGRRLPSAVSGLAGVGLVAALVPGPVEFWAALHRTRPDHVVFAEDASGVVLLRDGPAGVTAMTVNGSEQAVLPYGGPNTLMGALPSLLHPRPRAILAVGLASGDSLYSAGGNPETEVLECVEIVAVQLPVLRRYAAERADPGLAALFADRRVHIAFGDARAALLETGRHYDIVQAYAQLPDQPHAGNLYSMEYFRLVASRLAPGGLVVSWDSTPRMRGTLRRVFPHVLVLGRVILAAREPIPFDPGRVRARLLDPTVQSHYRRAGIDIDAILAPFLDRSPTIYGPGDEPPEDVNTDLFPKDEYRVPLL